MEFCRGDPSRTVSSNIWPSPRKCHGPESIFSLDGDNRFMKPSWVRAHGLIFGKVYMVWVCAPPNFKSYSHVIALQPVGTVPGPFRPRFGLPAKKVTAQNRNFALEGYNRFMRPSWVRAHGLIFGKIYIVWVCAPAYNFLSCRRNRIRENRT